MEIVIGGLQSRRQVWIMKTEDCVSAESREMRDGRWKTAVERGKLGGQWIDWGWYIVA
jgi:hypothetical protein